MLKSSIGAACATVLVALAGGLVTPTASHAATYGGVFDPENDNYRWFGNHVFTVDNNCLQGGDGWRLVNGYDGAGCGTARLTGGDLTVINKQPPGGEVSRTIQFSDFEFIPTSTDPIVGPDVWGVYVLGGEAVGFDTVDIGDFTFNVDPTNTHGGDWRLQWSSGLAIGSYCDYFPFSDKCFPAGLASALSAGSPSANSTAVGVGTVSLFNYLPNQLNPNPLVPRVTDKPLTFVRLDPTNPVPAPTTVSLVLAALAAGWLTRRRKR